MKNFDDRNRLKKVDNILFGFTVLNMSLSANIFWYSQTNYSDLKVVTQTLCTCGEKQRHSKLGIKI